MKGFRTRRLSAFAMVILLAVPLFLPLGKGTAFAGTENLKTGEDTMTTYHAYPLSAVDVTDTYLTNAEDKDIEYLLSLDADRLVAGFRDTAGLDTKGKSRYAGWESSLIGGHTLGHYLTAVAQAVAALPSSDSRKAELNDRLTYIINALKECQDAIGTGFLFGSTILTRNNIELQFDNVENNKTNISSEAWVPWYTMHKILAGILDVYKYTGNETALDIACGLGDWVYARTASWSASIQRTVLNIEYGGMNDCLYELYAATGEEKYAIAAHCFDDESLFQTVSKGGKNALNNRHANTTIPKFIGALNRYVTTHGQTISGEVVDASDYLDYARNFFTMVLERHTYVTGDNSEWEHFGADNILDAERTNCNCETCNAYNMLKFAKALFMATGDVSYLQYYETTFYNTILSSQNPQTGMTTYFQPMASGYFKVYTTPIGSFWCCTGSGMENFTKLGNAIYYSNEENIFVSQYLSSVLTDEEKNIKLTMEADIPSSDEISILVNTLDGSTDVTNSICLRLPEWLAEDATILVSTAYSSSFARVEMNENHAIVSGLKNGDRIYITLPMDITVHGLPDNDSVFAFKYGPIVLSAKLGSKNMTTTYTGVSVLIPAAKLIEEQYISDGDDTISVIQGTVADFMANINENLVKTEGKLEWTLENTDANLTFVPHYSQHTERYGIYFNYESNSGAFNVSRYLREKDDARFADALLDTVQPGYGQYENDSLHNMQETGTGSTGSTNQGTSRFANAGGAFTYTMYVNPNVDNALQLTLKKEDNGKSLQIFVGEECVCTEVLSYTGPDEEYTVRIPVSKEVLALSALALKESHPATGETAYTVNVTFASADEKASARICNYLYMTEAYTKNTGATFNAIDTATGKNYLSTNTEDQTYLFTVPAGTNSLDIITTTEDEHGYVRVNGSVAKDTYTVDLSRNNFVTLTYTVYAEDHETTADYTVVIEQEIGERTDVDPTLAYFVNCGDFDVTTVTDKDLFGIYNGVTEQVYGKDPVTGKLWGIVDTVSDPLKNGTANHANMINAVFTDNTWPFETAAGYSDTTKKALTNRYTKNQFENGMPRKLNYRFELPDGEYTVKLYFADPWNCSKNPIVTINGKEKLNNIPVNKVVSTTAVITDGELDLVITAPASTLCINLCYILIYLPENALVTPEPTAVPTNAPTEPAVAPSDSPTDIPAGSDSSFPTALVAGLAVAIGAVAGILTYLIKKKKK